MANEFVARNGLIAQDNSIISGSLIVTNGITGSISGTGSYANNANSASYSLTATSASYAVNAASAVSASYALDATSASFATTASYWTGSVNAITSSFATNAGLLNNTGSNGFTTTSSFQTYTSSNDLINTTQSARLTSLEGVSASFFSYTQSNDAKVASIYGATSSLQSATSSIQAFSSSILSYTASTDNRIGALNSFSSSILSYTSSTDAKISSINLATASLNFQTASLLSYTSSTDAKIASIYNNTSSLNTFSGSILNYTSSTDAKISALYTYTSSLNNKTSSFATTGSNTFIGNQTITGSINVSGSINATGTLTAQTLIVQVITSSQDFVTGSTKFGSLTSNTHQFTGSVSASGSLAINTNVLYVDGTNVGIGTTAVNAKLEVYNGTARFWHGGTSYYTEFNGSNEINTYTSAGAVSPMFLNWATGGDVNIAKNAIFAKNAGSVGIGITNPSQKLHINGGSLLVSTTSSGSGADANSGIRIVAPIATTHYNWMIGAQQNVSAGFEITPSTTVGGTTFSSPKLVILADGNVGIGTTPIFKLDVYGGNSRINSGTYSFEYGITSNSGFIQAYNNTGAAAIPLLFYVGTSQAMVINANGNVGIGTTNPTQKLHVSGGYIITRDSAGQEAFIQGSDTYAYFGNLNAGPAAFGNSDSYTTLVADGTNVGIGTTSPGAKLDLGYWTFNGNNRPLYVRNSAGSINSNDYDTMIIQQDDVTSLRMVERNVGGTDQLLTFSIGDGFGRIATSHQPLQFYVSGSPTGVTYTGLSGTLAMHIATDATIGIATSSPKAQLYIFNNKTYSAANINEATGSSMAFRIKSRAGSSVEMSIGAFDSTQAGLQAFNTSSGAAVGFLLNPYGGNIGIGTTSPSSLLHTYTSGDNIIRVQTTGNSTAANYFMTNVSGTAKRYYAGVNISSAGGAYEIYDDTAGASRLIILTGGSVGIGTTSPTARLQISGDGSSYNQLRINHNGSGTNGFLDINVTDTRATILTNYSSNNIPLEIKSYGNTNQLFLATTGYVGIGTSNPQTELHIAGISGWAELRLAGSTAGSGGSLEFYSGSVQLGDIYMGSSKDLTFRVNGASTVMYIKSDGNVGIGTTSPDEKLRVSGKIKADAVYVYDGLTTGQTGIGASSSGGDLRFYQNGSIGAVITTTGNVGIGTTSPQEYLHIVGTNDFTRGLRFSEGGNNYRNGIYFGSPGGSASGWGLDFYTAASSTGTTTNLSLRGNGVSYFNAGNVGIGTSSPSQLLHLYKSSGTIFLTLQSSTNYGYFYNDGTNIGLASDVGSTGLKFIVNRNAPDSAVVINSNGNVGIGTTSPNAPLHVYKDAGDGNSVMRIRNTNSTFRTTLLQFEDYAGAYADGLIAFNVKSGAAAGSYLGIGVSTTGSLVVAYGGNIGIATTSPSALLHVQGLGSSGGDSVYITNRRGGYFPLRVLVTQGDYHGVLIEHQDGDGSGGAGPSGSYGFKFDDKRVSGTYTGHPSASFVIARSNTYNNTNIFEVRPYNTTAAIAVATGGNVGIGSASPSYKLDVSGDGRFTSNVYSNTNLGFINNNASQAGFVADYTGTGALKVSFSTYNNTMNIYNETNAYSIINFTPSTKNLIFNPSGGNVGIGTTSPGYKLDVKGTGYFDGPVYVGTTSNRNYFSRGDIRLTDASSNVYVLDISVSSTSGYISTNYYGGGANMPLVLQSYGNNNQLYLATSGNVGINTTAPTEKLQVDGYILNRSKLGFVQRHDIVKNGLTFYVDFNNKNCWDPVVDGTPSGTSVKDLSNNKYLVAFSGTATVAAKDGNYGLYGNGAGNYMAVKDYTLSSLPHTWEAWVLADGLSGYDTFWDSGTERPLFGALSANPIFYPDAAVSSVTLSTGKWYHFVVAMASNNTYQFYMNGRQISSTTYGSVIRTGTFDMWLGGDTSAESWNGYIPIARMYNRQLSATEVMQNYNAEKWRFDNSSTFYHDVATGRVGIGTTNPEYSLHISGTQSLLKIQSSGATFGSPSINLLQGAIDTVLSATNNGLEIGTWSAHPIYFKTQQSTAMTVLNGGNVGVGTTNPAYLLDVSGTIRATGDVIAYSDARVKENVNTITDALTKVTSLRGVSYTRNDSEDKSEKVGVIAQEVLEILPQVVQQDTEGNYSVAYGNIVGVLIEAIKELNAKIDRLENK
jgi:hypothetical protein